MRTVWALSFLFKNNNLTLYEKGGHLHEKHLIYILKQLGWPNLA